MTSCRRPPTQRHSVGSRQSPNTIPPICHPKIKNVRNRRRLINLIANNFLTMSPASGPKHFNHGRIRRLPLSTDELGATTKFLTKKKNSTVLGRLSVTPVVQLQTSQPMIDKHDEPSYMHL